VWLAALGIEAGAQSADDLFDPTTLHEIRLLINARDLRALHEQYLENTYYTADFYWRDVHVRNVGVRSRGSGSRNPVKLGLRIDFNRFVTGQHFAGLASLVLDNLWQDASMLRERTAMAFFARMGHPASRESFARLYINDEYQGVYAMVEPVDAQYVARTFGDPSGFVYEYHWLEPYYFGNLGDDLAAYESRFEAQTHRTDPPAVLYGPVRDMVQQINAPLDSTWRTTVDSYVDLRQFVEHAAIEAFLSELDGAIGYAGLNNFYLYRQPSSTRHAFIPWDRDNAFQDVESSVFQRVRENLLLERAFGFADLQAHYLDVLERAANAATQDGWLEHEILAAASLTREPAMQDPLKPYSNNMQNDAVTFLLDFARRRPAQVLAEVAHARTVVLERSRALR
jgi:spore coat protein CotH